MKPMLGLITALLLAPLAALHAAANWQRTQKAKSVDCKCEDCRGPRAFVLDAQAQVARFRIRQDRRQRFARIPP